ncbi:MAG: uroporphyrinogen-III synthase [Psychromonas sp.]|nr:uroporphyrinogen-III synthase [Psychromonas sp.]
MAKPRLLVTRFAPHAARLANQLNAQGVFALPQPLLEIQKSPEFAEARLVFAHIYDYIIAVSCNAVDYSDQALLGSPWPVTCYLAVGQATQAKLKTVTGQPVMLPESAFNSEGLLDLPCMAELQGKQVLILRGVGGRELLAEVLTSRGAEVHYYQPYQRVALNVCGALLVKQWQQQRINGAIISSVELLQRLLDIVPENQLSWLNEITIYAPSARIAEQAILFGWHHVECLPGMQDQQIVDYFK